MTNLADIAGKLTVAQAAQILSVSEHQVRALAAVGELTSIRISERFQLLEADSVLRYKQLYAGKGRPLSPLQAFAVLGEISGEPVEGLSYQQCRRLHQKLKEISAEELVWQTRRRKSTKRFRCSESFLRELSSSLVLTGVSASESGFDLIANQSLLEGYCEAAKTASLASRFFLKEDSLGNVVLHECQKNPWQGAKQMPIGVVAADLAESLNAREHAAGIAKLEELINEYTHLSNN